MKSCENCIFVIKHLNKETNKIEIHHCGKKVAIAKEDFKCKEYENG